MTKLRISFLILFFASLTSILIVMSMNKYFFRETSIKIFQKINLIGSGVEVSKEGGHDGSHLEHDLHQLQEKNKEDTLSVTKPPEKENNAPTVDNNNSVNNIKKQGNGEVTATNSNTQKVVSPPKAASTNTEPPKSKAETLNSATKNVLDDGELETCPKSGRALVGLMYVDQTVPKMEDLEKQMSVIHGGTVEKGGWWKPSDCKPRAKTAVIIPYRNREQQLKMFLRHLHPILQRQLLEYRIIVVDQAGNTPFNRAGLFNVGYKEALKLGDFNCLVFSDVDLLPEDDRNNYGCPTSPRHMSVAVDKFNYQLPYATIFGGVGAFKKDHFESVNGFSNRFWGWGGEDDDLYNRIVAKGFQLSRPSLKIGRYTMIRVHHFQSHGMDPNRMNLLQNSRERMGSDGLSSLSYQVQELKELPLVTIVTVNIDRT